MMQRQHGLACNRVVGITMVDANGEVVTANAQQNPDLLGASCGGGGGNFGAQPLLWPLLLLHMCCLVDPVLPLLCVLPLQLMCESICMCVYCRCLYCQASSLSGTSKSWMCPPQSPWCSSHSVSPTRLPASPAACPAAAWWPASQPVQRRSKGLPPCPPPSPHARMRPCPVCLPAGL